tara:strand:+ start:1208 stop:1318 length:111 start_codon:yes stop_codon:yes gene_type:complete
MEQKFNRNPQYRDEPLKKEPSEEPQVETEEDEEGGE